MIFVPIGKKVIPGHGWATGATAALKITKCKIIRAMTSAHSYTAALKFNRKLFLKSCKIFINLDD